VPQLATASVPTPRLSGTVQYGSKERTRTKKREYSAHEPPECQEKNGEYAEINIHRLSPVSRDFPFAVSDTAILPNPCLIPRPSGYSDELIIYLTPAGKFGICLGLAILAKETTDADQA